MTRMLGNERVSGEGGDEPEAERKLFFDERKDVVKIKTS